MIECGAAYPPLILENGEIYRLFTCMFLHFGIYHIANNMLVLFVLGQRLEPVVGKIKFILIYLLGGLGGKYFFFYYGNEISGLCSVSWCLWCRFLQ